MKYFFCLLFLLSFGSINCQLAFNDLDYDRLHQKKIRKFVNRHIDEDKKFFCDLHPGDSDSVQLNKMQNQYLVKESVDDVWDAYKNANPCDIWNGRMVSFGFLCSKWYNFIVYKNDSAYGCIDTGQVVFINLKLLWGLYNLPVGIQILDVDDENMNITLSYLEGGKSIGTQIIQLSEMESGTTCISHITGFKSSSDFRDRHLYPYYHTKVLNEFHRNILKNLDPGIVILATNPSKDFER